MTPSNTDYPDLLKESPRTVLDMLNSALKIAIDTLHQTQGSRRDGSLHLSVRTQHQPRCLGCPHYEWVVWQKRIARSGPDSGNRFYTAVPCASPLRTRAARNPDVREVVQAILKLLQQRARLVESMSHTQRLSAASIKLLSTYTQA